MCLKIVTRVPRKIDNVVHIGYKVFAIDPNAHNGLRFQYFARGGSFARGEVGDVRHVSRGRWLNASNSRIWAKNRWYPTGFHIYVNQADAEADASISWCTGEVVEVRYRRVVAEGTQTVVDFRKSPPQRVAPVVVAKQMYVPRCSRSAKQ